MILRSLFRRRVYVKCCMCGFSIKKEMFIQWLKSHDEVFPLVSHDSSFCRSGAKMIYEDRIRLLVEEKQNGL